MVKIISIKKTLYQKLTLVTLLTGIIHQPYYFI